MNVRCATGSTDPPAVPGRSPVGPGFRIRQVALIIALALVVALPAGHRATAADDARAADTATSPVTARAGDAVTPADDAARGDLPGAGHVAHDDVDEHAALAEIVALEYARVPSVELFVPHLIAPAPAIRRRAALALARATPSDAAPVLAPLLADDDAGVRRMTAFALGQLADSTATTALGAAADGDDPWLADQALGALGKIGGADAARIVAAHLDATDPMIRASSALALARMTDTTRIDVVLARLPRETDPGVLWTLARACESATDLPRTIDALGPLLAHRSPVVRSAASRALGRLGDARAVRPLLPLLTDGQWRVRVESAGALGRIADAAALESLIALSADPVHHVREAAITALGAIGDVRAAATLRHACVDASVGVRRAAATALGLLEPGDDRSSAAAQGEASEKATEAARDIARASAEILAASLEDPEPAVAAAALAALARLRGVEVLDLLLEHTLIGYPGPVRIAAIAALGELGEVAGLGTLIDLLEDPDPVVATVAAGALGELGDDAAQSSLLEAFETHDTFETFDVRLAAVEALGRLGDHRARPLVLEAALDRDPRLRELAWATIDSIGGRAGTDSLRAWAREDSLVRSMPPGDGGPRLGSPPRDFPLVNAITGVRRVRLVTSRGAIELELLPELAPMTVESFVRLAERGFYADGVFHRVVPGFVVQGGCPRHDGWGGPGYALRSEWNPEHYGVGTVGMAHAGRDTGGSQFFITQAAQPHLDGRYTVFARVVSGMSVVDAVEQGDSFSVQLLGR